MAYRIHLTEAALADLDEIYAYVADAAGDEVAERFDRRLQAGCCRLDNFPGRGTPRDELKAGARSIAVERRATILYEVDGDAVRILRILFAGQDLSSAFGARPDGER